MKSIINLLFEARALKNTPRTGYQFLGSGKESVAEHTFITAFIALVLSKIIPDIDTGKLLSMCLLHDLPEARTGDLNTVYKEYCTVDEKKAIDDLTKDLPFGKSIARILDEFNKGETIEALLAHDADQLAFIIDLKYLSDIGNRLPDKWIPPILERLKTDIGKATGESIANTDQDDWWLQNILKFKTDNKKQ